MPTYVYQILHKDGTPPDPGDFFEIQQRVGEPPLEQHPITGEPVKKVFTAPNLPTRYNEKAQKSKLTSQNLESHGFTRYEKDKSTGEYHRTAGKEGPSSFKKPEGL